VSEETRRYGRLIVLTPRMNPDLLMGDGLLKKTGAANLFMVFGEPDLDVKTLSDGRIQVELRGLDGYDPTTQALRNNSTGEVACWFIDTAYNGESFFVRHAYFGSSALSVQINLASKDSTPWKDKGLRETELVGGGRTFFLGGHLVVLF
jgi:hypothetical protein